MQGIKKVFTQTGWQIVGKIVTSLSTILVLSLVTREYGETGTGIFTLALTYLSFFYLAVDFGINAHVVPKLLNEGIIGHWQRLLGLRLVLAFILFNLSTTLVIFLPINDRFFQQSVLAGSLAVFGYAIFVSANAIFQMKLKYELSVIASCVGAVVTLVLIFIFSKTNLPLPYLMFAYIFGWFLCAIFALILVKKYVAISPIISLHYIFKTIRAVWPISLTLILNVLYFRIDAFILAALKPLSDVGIYNLPYQIFQAILVVPTFIMNSFYPLLVKDFLQDKSKFKKTLFNALYILTGFAIMGVVATLILAPFEIYIVSGGIGFENSTNVLRILSLSLPAFFLSSLFMWIMIVLKKYKTLLKIYLLGLSVNILLNILLIPRHSYYGAAWVTNISEYLILMLQVFILYKTNNKFKT